MKKLICYCYNYTEADIIADYHENNGRSSIMVKITKARKNKTCQCDDKHPEKRWCLPDVRRVVDRLKKENAI